MSKYLDGSGLLYFWQKLKPVLAGKATVQQYAATLLAEDWSATAPYTQTVEVEGVLGTDTPLVDVVLSDDAEDAVAELEAYGLVGRLDTDEDEITVTCYEDVPEVDLTLALKVVR